MNAPHPDPLLDLWQAADYLGYTESAVRRLVRDGVIPVIKLGGKTKSRLRVRQSALDALIEASTSPARTGALAHRPPTATCRWRAPTARRGSCPTRSSRPGT